MPKAVQSIRRKLRNVILAACVAVLLLTSAVFVGYEYVTFRKLLIEHNATVAQIIAANASPAVAFENDPDAAEVLSSLKQEPEVEAAALYIKSGALFAVYPPGHTNIAIPLTAPEPTTSLAGGKIINVRKIQQNQATVGTLYLQSSLAPLNERIRVYVIITMVILLGSFLVALAISFWLERRISYPIIALSGAARKVSETRDFSHRAKKLTEDEIGALTESFNDMLEQIESRDSALRQNAARLRLALQASQTGTWDWEISSDTLSWDEFVPPLFGIKAGDFGGAFESFLSLVHPADREPVKNAIDRAINQRSDFVAEFRAVWPDKSVRYMASRGRAIYNDQAAATRVVGVILDITETKKAEINLRESEQRFRNMADAAPVLIWTSTPDNRREYVNRAWLEFTGRTAEHELDYGWVKGIHEEDRAAVVEAFKIASQKQVSFSLEYRLRRHDGVCRWMHDHGAPRFGSDNSFQGYIGSCIDINDRKTAQAELEQRVHDRTLDLQASNKELEAFTYSVSHDLRSPLRHIDGYAQILQEEFEKDLPQAAQKYLKRIRSGTQNMGRLVDDLLNLARVGRQELTTQPCDLNLLVEEILEDLKNDTHDRSIEWRIGKLPKVEVDAGLIKQVFANLLSNAAKYSRPRELAVIEVGAIEKAGERAIFVKDNGVGFNMKYAPKLFGVFQRLHRAEDFEGTGVGLATVERIIRKHGGRIWAEAEEGKGATFFFTLPRLQTDDQN